MTAKPQSRLDSVQRGPLQTPLRILIHSIAGLGKSTMGAYAPSSIFLDAEDGTELLDVARYSFRDETGGHIPESLDEVYAALADLQISEHSYKTLVIDTIDRVEALLCAHCCKRDGKENIPGYGYGKGELVALDEWRLLCSKLDRLRLTRGMTILMLGHSQIRAFADPEGEAYDRYSLKVEKRAAGFLTEWCDMVLFGRFEDTAGKLSGQERAQGYSTGRRLLRTEHSATSDAKSRVPLPPEIDLVEGDPWAPLADAIEAGRTMPAKAIIALIKEELEGIGDDALTKKVSAATKKAKSNTAELGRYLQGLRRQHAQGAKS